MPARVSVYDDPELLRTSPYLKVMRTILAQARPRPVHPLYARISDILQVRLSAALIGQLSPEAAIKTAAQEIRVVLGESDG